MQEIKVLIKGMKKRISKVTITVVILLEDRLTAILVDTKTKI